MSCIKLPPITPPRLPGGISLGFPPIPDPPGLDLRLCCKIVAFTIPPPPIAIPSVVLTSTVVDTLEGFIAAACSYVNGLALDCPIE